MDCLEAQAHVLESVEKNKATSLEVKGALSAIPWFLFTSGDWARLVRQLFIFKVKANKTDTNKQTNKQTTNK